MTKEEQLELIAKARELCEQQIADHTPRESWTVENYPAYWLAHYQTTLNSWTTHLAEMDELERLIDHIDVCGENYACAEHEWAYSAESELLTKAKRLLGVE